MSYFTNLQRAIAATQQQFNVLDFGADPHGELDSAVEIQAASDYAEGWTECGSDLAYGLSLGSEHAVSQQLQFWLDADLDTYQTDDPAGDMAYKSRSEEIYRLMQSYKDIQ